MTPEESRLADLARSMFDAYDRLQLDAVTHYIVCGADIDARDEAGGHTLLSRAVRDMQDTDIELFLSFKADPNIPCGKEGRTTLHHAAANMDEKVARLLIEHGADCRLPDAQGIYPLHIAARRGDQAMVELLLRAGADVLQQDPDGRTARDIATAYAKDRALPHHRAYKRIASLLDLIEDHEHTARTAAAHAHNLRAAERDHAALRARKETGAQIIPFRKRPPAP
jgi:ankyrin repeat protein